MNKPDFDCICLAVTVLHQWLKLEISLSHGEYQVVSRHLSQLGLHPVSEHAGTAPHVVQ